MLSFGDFAGASNGALTVDGGAGEDTISFGDDAGSGGAIASAAARSFSLLSAQAGTLVVDGGADTISFGARAGAGADTIRIGDQAESLRVNLGAADGAADTVIFDGLILSGEIFNRVFGEDTLIDVATNASQWTATDNGTDTQLSNTIDGSEILLRSVTGFGTNVEDYLM